MAIEISLLGISVFFNISLRLINSDSRIAWNAH